VLLHGFSIEFPEKPMQGAIENAPLTGRLPQEPVIPSKEQKNQRFLLESSQQQKKGSV
jgi:hypothetical protein